ncbi:MAG: hypothetical protein JNN15_21120 [Blastocatellia bacterium]|nr:hypothetical protein [Blastocatellia bacterium]
MKLSKLSLLSILGVVFWLSAALFVRFAGEKIFSENNSNLIILFLLSFPISYGLIFITQKVANLKQSELLQAVSLMTFVAAFLDGTAMLWFKQLYGTTFETCFYGAAWILWGAACGLFLGYLLDRPEQKTA